MVRSFGVGVASGPPEPHKKIDTDGPEHNICIGEQASVSGQLLEPDGTTAHHEQGVLVTFNGVSIANPTNQTDPDGYASLTYTPTVGNKTVQAAAPDYQAYHEPSRFAVVEVQSLAPDEGTQVDTIQTGPDNVSTDVWVVPWEPDDDPSAPGPFVNVPATPNPDVSLADLPPGWSLREGEYGDPIPRADQDGDGVDDNTGETKKLAKVDKSDPGSTLVIADAGTSHKRALVKVAKVNLTADLHGDGGVNHGTPEPEDEQQEASEGGDVYISATAPAADSPDTEAIMRLWETWAPTDPNADIALAVDDPTIVQLWSLRADNTWHKESTPLTWAGADGPPGELYVEGLKKGTTNLTLKYKYNGHTTGVKDEVKVTVGDIKVEWEEIDSPLDTNPNKGGGKRIFPGKQDPGDNTDRDTVRVKVTVHPAQAGVTVYLKAFDVDDPSASTSPVDDESNPTDNRGGFAWPNAVPDGDGIVALTTDGNGQATEDLRVSMQPGDNTRVVANRDRQFIVDSQAEQDVEDGRVIDGNDDKLPSNLNTPMLTMWRNLHIESDSMSSVTGNFEDQEAILHVLSTFGPEGNLRWFEISDLSEWWPEEDDHFNNGILTVYFNNTPVEFKIYDFKAIANERVLIENNPSLGAGLSIKIEDDDVAKIPAGANGVDPISLPRKPKIGSAQKVFSPAYLKLRDAGGYDGSINFIVNTEDTSIANQQADFSSEDAFWVVKIVSAFQPVTSVDADPDTEVESAQGITGNVGAMFSRPGGSLVFLETIRDSALSISYDRDKFEWLIIAHEIGHQFNLSHSIGYNETQGVPNDDYLMTDEFGPGGTWPNEEFSPAGLNEIRTIDYPYYDASN